MRKPDNSPDAHTAPIVNWRAAQISDPVERLKYLRRVAARAGDAQKRRQTIEPTRRVWIAGAAGAAAIVGGFAAFPRLSRASRQQPAADPAAAPASSPITPEAANQWPEIWLVEKTREFEVYSNGLRIEIAGAVSEGARRYLPLDRGKPETWKRAGDRTNFSSDPIGIVYHTTESDVAPFERDHNSTLKRLAGNVLAYVRNIRAYHYLVDRFGRVHRVVEEESFANHAGWSVWADAQSVYVNLNHSFFGISFEGQTRPQDGSETINSAQTHAARVLTDMLRGKYKIRSENCVTHAQVSVNPDKLLIGAHTDWSSDFPFQEMGLPENYSIPIPAITQFGFSYDPGYLEVSEGRLWRGLLLADEEIRRQASAKKMKPAAYKVLLNQRYRDAVAALRLK